MFQDATNKTDPGSETKKVDYVARGSVSDEGCGPGVVIFCIDDDDLLYVKQLSEIEACYAKLFEFEYAFNEAAELYTITGNADHAAVGDFIFLPGDALLSGLWKCDEVS